MLSAHCLAPNLRTLRGPGLGADKSKKQMLV